MKKISICLWFDKEGAQAADFYSSVFNGPNSHQPRAKDHNVMAVPFQIEGLDILALNGGPRFKFTPSFSFFVSCATEAEIDEKWAQLSEGGKVRMEIGKYPWSERYGWTADRFGVEWQLILSPRSHKVSPSLLFVDKLFGKGEEAIHFYTSLFANSKVETIAKDEATKSVMHCAFTLNGQGFTLMEGQGNHGHTFSEATSIVVNCENQEEVDHYWEKLSQGGSTGQCGWLKDKYGVSWQVVPTALGALMTSPEKSKKVMQAMLKMTRLIIADLEAAAR